MEVTGSYVIAALTALFFGACCVGWCVLFFRRRASDAVAIEGKLPRDYKVLCYLVLSRVLCYLVAYLLAPGEGAFGESMHSVFMRGDAPHYLGIAEFGYQTVGDAKYHIVFFPLYPLLVWLVRFVVRDYFLAALVVSNAATVGGCYLLHGMVAREYGTQAAGRTLRYLLLFPAAVFYCAPFTEGLFLLLTVAFFYFLQEDKWLLAGLMGALAAFTRSLGVLLFVPVVVQALLRFDRAQLARSLRRFGAALLAPMGLVAYMGVNRAVTGNALQFMEYQRDHWSQNVGNPIETVRMIAQYALSPSAWPSDIRASIWLPQLVCIVAAVALLVPTIKKTHLPLSAFALAYVFSALTPTWLLSAPRYLGVLFPLALGLALCVKKKWLDYAVTAGLGAYALYYFWMFIHFAHVY